MSKSLLKNPLFLVLLAAIGIVGFLYLTGSTSAADILESKAKVKCTVEVRDLPLFDPQIVGTPSCIVIDRPRLCTEALSLFSTASDLRLTTDSGDQSVTGITTGTFETSVFSGILCTNDMKVFVELVGEGGGVTDSRTVFIQ